MAAEIMRVGKKWFITTPNRWFPFEFHLRLPVVSWLPYKIMNKKDTCIVITMLKKNINMA
jgi:hypothetical protein